MRCELSKRVKIVKASQDDINGIYELFTQIFSGLADYYGKKWTKEAERCARKWLTLVAKKNGKIIGFLATRQLKDGVTAYVEWFGISEGNRQQGIGTKMMRRMLKGLKILGFKKVLIRAGNWDEHTNGAWRIVNYGDSKSVKFYRKFGFQYHKGWMKVIL